MGRQIKKNPEVEALQQKASQPEMTLDDVSEEESFNVAIDEEEGQVVLEISYRIKFGDPVDVNIDHEFSPLEAKQFALELVEAAEEVEKLMAAKKAGEKVEEVVKENKEETTITDAEVENGNPNV